MDNVLLAGRLKTSAVGAPLQTNDSIGHQRTQLTEANGAINRLSPGVFAREFWTAMWGAKTSATSGRTANRTNKTYILWKTKFSSSRQHPTIPPTQLRCSFGHRYNSHPCPRLTPPASPFLVHHLDGQRGERWCGRWDCCWCSRALPPLAIG